MSDVWAPVIAALGASLLTGLFGFGLEWWRLRSAKKEAFVERRSRAYSTLLARSVSITYLAQNLHNAIEIRSGVREGINVTLRYQKAIDLLDLAKWMETEFQPAFEAWSEVWVVGSQEAIAEANDLITKCGAVLETATQRGQGRPDWLRGIAGEKWTKEQLEQLQEEVKGIAEARRQLAKIVRKETGLDVADVFASNESEPARSSQSSVAESPVAGEKRC